MRTLGGPYADETRVVPRSVLGWPPPVHLPGVFKGGVYVRASYSQLPEQPPPEIALMRGVQYQWREIV